MSKHTNRIVLAAALWAAGSIPAQAQVVCAERLRVTEHLARNFQEKPAGTGLTHAGRAIELFVAETGTWTIVIVTPAGGVLWLVAWACLAAAAGRPRTIVAETEEVVEFRTGD